MTKTRTRHLSLNAAIRRRYLCFTIAITLLTGGTAYGRVFFLPGDAFFHFVVDEHAIKRMSNLERGPLVLAYSPADRLGALGLQIGFTMCEINDCQRQDLSRFLKCCEIVRKRQQDWNPKNDVDDEDRTDDERDEVHCFIYGTKFDYQEFHIGLKYNESWNETMEFDTGFGRGEIVSKSAYDSFSSDRGMIVEDWLNSKRVAELPGTIPDGVKWKLWGKFLDKAYTIQADEVYFVLASGPQLPGVIQAAEHSWFCKVSKNGQWFVTREPKKWTQIEIDLSRK